MSVTFWITFSNPAIERQQKIDFEIDPKIYRQEIEKKWPSTEFFEPTSNFILLYCQIPTAIDGEVGTPIQLYGNSVALDPSLDSATFIIWHRQFVPSSYPLFLSVDMDPHYGVLELNEGTTVESINRFLFG
ncbi:MAG: hypothetical protein DPW16_01145 [Chloroflexi bacterium]|nr:hypothetical protein [Chloroflexota bacterium]